MRELRPSQVPFRALAARNLSLCRSLHAETQNTRCQMMRGSRPGLRTQRRRPIFSDGLLKTLAGLCQLFSAALVRVVSALQIGLLGLRMHRLHLSKVSLLLGC